ncbi:deoxyribodipyrimidine photo-lyase [Tenacibaculum adriaticum]|uniref:Deoxyribodipyrimidine photo-lyase n=1 Tax=Tenacibaculum adriaticum TaxID=413713 RepID=A0A5S5DQW9_9FLAO|nr:deoxyribodipyrimidine photo-lyase [Tenacibaculum adriaticum]TYP97406.1 deoxyribodipyrimidine photo-lyase [Tenacibaculum adriaticum]
MGNINIFWFRRDLRLQDNHALYRALKSSKPVLPIFIFDTNILEKLPKNDARITFIHQQLLKIDTELKKNGSSLHLFFGKPSEIYKQLTENYSIDTVYTNRDYEPYGIQRDKEIANVLATKNISFKSYKDHVIFEKNEITKQDETPYKVYTPYSKKWLAEFQQKEISIYPSEEYQQNFIKKNTSSFLSLNKLGFEKSLIKIPEYDINLDLVNNYEEVRNFPAIKGTSKLGVHLRFGTISIRKAVLQASKSNNSTFLKELIWREFFIQILWHFPQTVTKAFKPKYDFIKWRNNLEEFKKWCEGKTGYPLVDAGMRELNTTGFMHNRVRMLVGSFLCKHLLIDWRWGEAYFAEKLLDFELASNIGNWQWVAGCGVDAAPYFRIFNPTTQIQKFDKDLNYIKKWVPEFQELTYPTPIVDHKFARERCLTTYKLALNQP